MTIPAEEIYGSKKGDPYGDLRGRLFSEVFCTLKREGILSVHKKSWIYSPAANKQLETRIFGSLSDNDGLLEFVGGDILEGLVREGSRDAGGNTSFLVADGFRAPFKSESLKAVADIAGVAWYALDADTEEKAASNFESLFCEWHRVLDSGGCVILDDFDRYWPNSDITPENYSGKDCKYESTMRLLEKKAPKIFGTVKRGGELRLRTADGDAVAFRARALELESGNGRIYVFEKV